MKITEKLKEMQSFCADRLTEGLSEQQLSGFWESDTRLTDAVGQAYENHKSFRSDFEEILRLPEIDQIKKLQGSITNFYKEVTVNPYVALGASGPWIVTSCGAVLHDSGGYGMLGLGHGPQDVIDRMANNVVMANVMTPSFSQYKLTNLLQKEIGHTRTSGCPYESFIFMNSGSESVTVATRVSDVNAKENAGNRTVKLLSLKGGFHGRTGRPAQASDSTIGSYKQHLNTFSERDTLDTVPLNDVKALQAVFDEAKASNVFYELVLMEPVMGEGNPGEGLTPEFYQLVRKLTKEHGSLFLIDSIQAGLRAHGTLSVVDYPGFERFEAPDMETYSKALNAGQYPLSVLALSRRAADLYRVGIYGNTMTSNPRAMEVGCAVLEGLTDKLRANIVERGKEFVSKFKQLQAKHPDIVTHVQGTGLLFSVEIASDKFEVVADEGLEVKLRKKGIGVIHGGENSLRFTPPFDITSDEVDLIVDAVADIIS